MSGRSENRTETRFIVAVSLFFVLAVSLGLHGYSLPAWQGVLGESTSGGLLFGRPRDIRTDDWALDLPLALAQSNQKPALPLLNKSFGFGQNMLLPIRIPVLHPTLIFRPSLWGYLVDADRGISFQWWFQVLGILLASFFVLRSVFSIEPSTSILLSLILVFSPFFQFWSFHKGEIFFAGLLMILTFHYWCKSKNRWNALGWGLGFGWAAGVLALNHIYPPYQVPMAYLVAVFMLCSFWELRESSSAHIPIQNKLLLLLPGIGLLLFGLISFWMGARDSIAILNATSYPGQRMHSGGGYPFYTFFSNNFFLRFQVRDWHPFGNICESSSWFFHFPWMFLCLGLIRDLRRWSWIQFGLFVFILLLACYAYLGLPDWFAKATMLGKMTPNRIQQGLIFADLLLLGSFLRSWAVTSPKVSNFERGSILLVYSGFLIFFGSLLSAQSAEIRFWKLFLAGVANLIFVDLFLRDAFRQRALTGLLFVSLMLTINFNPLVRGGATAFQNSELAKTVKTVSSADQKQSRWIVLGSESIAIFSNYLRGLGVPTLTGYYGVPQSKIWENLRIDPLDPRVNQAGYLFAELDSSGEVRVNSPSPGNIWLKISPADSALMSLNTRWFLTDLPNILTFQDKNRFRLVKATSKWSIFERLY